MITWFQRAFGKHNKWILMAFLVVLFLSFIVSIGAVPRGSMTAQRKTQQLFLGVDLNDADAVQAVARAVSFTYERLYSQRVETAEQLDKLVTQQIALKYYADQWQIPESTPQQIEDFVKTLPAFRTPDGVFSPSLYTLFRDEVQASPPDQRDETARILASASRLDHVRRILSGPGYFLPGNAQTALLQIQNSQDNFKFNLEAATMDFAKFEPKIETDETKLNAELQKLFASDPTKFPQPAQAQLSYVKFPAATVPEPSADQLHTYAAAHKDVYPGIASGNLTEKDWTAVADAWRTDQKTAAATAAKTAAMNFARELYNLKTSPDKPEFAALLKKYNLSPVTMPLVTQGQPGPADSPIPDEVLQEIIAGLSPTQYFAPVPLQDGAGVVFLLHGTPARASTFAEARTAVLKAYTEQDKMKQFTAHGEEVKAAVTKEMAAGKTFREAAVAQNLSVKDYADVSDAGLRDAAMEILNPSAKDAAPTTPLAAMGRDLLGSLENPDANGVPLLLTLHSGEVSKMLIAADSGILVHVTKRDPAQIEIDSPEVKKLQTFMKDQEGAYDARDIINRLLQAAQPPPKPAGS